VKRIAMLATLAVWCGTCLLADFSYEQTSKMTGGMMAGVMKFAGAFSKQAREPIKTTVLVKGNRMAQLSSTIGHIIDLDKETITDIDFQKRTYSVVTFAQMAEALKQLEAKMKSEKGSEQANLNVKASVKETGQTKPFSGVTAREMVVTLEMEGTDQKTGQTGTFMVITADMWIAPQAGYDEVSQFHQRMGQKLNWAPGAGMFSQGRGDIARAMADVQKEAAKLDGLPVFQVVKMGMKGEPGQAGAAGAARPAEQPPARQPEAQPAERPSVGGALGRLGGGRLGRLGGLGRGKKTETQPEPQQPQPPAETAPAQGQQQADLSGALMEITTELTNFSSAPVDASKFEVPAGFRQVESETVKALRR
jgi:hypothetical protein